MTRTDAGQPGWTASTFLFYSLRMVRRGSAQAIGALLWLMAGSAPLFAQWCDEPLPFAATPPLGDDDTRVSGFEQASLARGTPDIPGLNIVWLTPWINPALARDWTNIVVHQSEGAAGSAWRQALAQKSKPDKRGATIWVETDGTVVWAVAEFARPSHTVSDRLDNRFVDNAPTYRRVTNDNSLGIEFVGNYPNVRRRPTDAQIRAWRILLQVLQVRYGIPAERVYAHNLISYKDRRYCEGCELAAIARTPPPDRALVLLATHR